jgi:hypothetical protein
MVWYGRWLKRHGTMAGKLECDVTDGSRPDAMAEYTGLRWQCGRMMNRSKGQHPASYVWIRSQSGHGLKSETLSSSGRDCQIQIRPYTGFDGGEK